MKVWRWGFEADKYETFSFPNPEDSKKYLRSRFNTEPLGEEWQNVHVEITGSRKVGDCTGVNSNIPIFSEQAVQVLAPYLTSNVELLPLQHPTKSFYAVNVTRLIDGLDYEKSIIEYIEEHPNVIKNVSSFAFKKDIIQDYPIFKIPEYKRLRVFVTDTFKSAVEASKLKGFTFELLWDSEANLNTEADLERQYQEMLAAVERNKGTEFSFQEAERRILDGEGCASGKWRLQHAPDGTVRLGNLQWDGTYNWIQPIFHPPILLDLMWHKVNILPID
ncbi:hypothetical protein CA600_03500 [Paenibacillus sp. VTT E-133280]|uniref:imm11 family protein n=1 Tax=Paenibacillus sp. VTT E-133280 TaxID=1986222 RepID=UPI000BA08E46|nr:DUF1629 domain-containing protein [Paenibacillus sp. VTT E-133280]OZQ69248.1 hypothetical protein CA600_03500 [Paenibacillus sp. VTT E-133280]